MRDPCGLLIRTNADDELIPSARYRTTLSVSFTYRIRYSLVILFHTIPSGMNFSPFISGNGKFLNTSVLWNPHLSPLILNQPWIWMGSESITFAGNGSPISVPFSSMQLHVTPENRSLSVGVM